MVAEYYSPPHRDEKFPDSPPHLWGGEIIEFQKMRPRWGAEYPFSPPSWGGEYGNFQNNPNFRRLRRSKPNFWPKTTSFLMKNVGFSSKITFWAPQAPKIFILPLIMEGRMTIFATNLGEKNIKFWNLLPRWGGRTAHSPPHYGGSIIDGFWLLPKSKKTFVFWGGDRPPIMGGERIFPPRSCILVNILPSMIFSWSILPPPEPMFWGGRTHLWLSLVQKIA